MLLNPRNAPAIIDRFNEKVILISGVDTSKHELDVTTSFIGPMTPDELSQPLDVGVGEVFTVGGRKVDTARLVGAQVASPRDVRRDRIRGERRCCDERSDYPYGVAHRSNETEVSYRHRRRAVFEVKMF
jgi:hypothetical protein